MDINEFIKRYITKRENSMFAEDIRNNSEKLNKGIKGKSVLVIGGAGSIGSAFVKEIIKFCPRSLVVVDINENALTELTRDLRSENAYVIPEEFVTYPMSYTSSAFERMFRKKRGFEIVANFSAHKHVRSEKDIYAIEELLNNNVLYTKKFLDLLVEYPPDEYFCVSTDKAANPVNVMGASKRIMEDLIFSYSDKFPVKTARFANVAFSNGSLPDGFLKRIAKLQPISAPIDVQRYFVSPEESGQICLISCILGPNRGILFPKLDQEQMMSFDEIAIHLLEEYGYKVKRCKTKSEVLEKTIELRKGGNIYPVVFEKSDTSGEKMYEEFYTDTEKVNLDLFISLGVIVDKEICDKERLFDFMLTMQRAFHEETANKTIIVQMMQSYLDCFEHIETGHSLDEKM